MHASGVDQHTTHTADQIKNRHFLGALIQIREKLALLTRSSESPLIQFSLINIDFGTDHLIEHV